MIVAQDGPYYLTYITGREQPFTLRGTARWRKALARDMIKP